MSKENPSVIALIPARAGSKRVRGKNVRPLAGHPLLAYSVCAARQSGVFAATLVSTDSEEYAEIARSYGAEVPFLRPAEISGDLSLDIEWVDFTLRRLREMGREYDAFSILRPTSPFRLPSTIQRAWREFQSEAGADSLRAVEKVKEHPGKMWVVRGKRMTPLLPFGSREQPWHSAPYQGLPEIYSQNASLEIAWTRAVFDGRTIAGETVMPFISQGYEGFDVNHPYDWDLAERLVASGEAQLPKVEKIS
ncbi:MAG: acylneuraminate cytidylyltransferase family protein [Anaerolineales bacterium]|nr:acylneuraminate cytidylyltransferase family protein [Anaerolineales bacterium]